VAGIQIQPIAMPASPDDLFSYLRDLGIETRTISHPPLFTVADSQALRGEIDGGHTKNLFLKDKKDNFFLVTAEEDAAVDLKSIHGLIGAASRVSFGKPEALLELLGVTPGAVTLFGLLNDKAGRVKFFIDESLLAHDVVNAHPLSNEATTSIRTDDVRRFVEATGHAFNVLKSGG
jgi:Ala-tRNA(Pro) deacylase